MNELLTDEQVAKLRDLLAKRRDELAGGYDVLASYTADEIANLTPAALSTIEALRAELRNAHTSDANAERDARTLEALVAGNEALRREVEAWHGALDHILAAVQARFNKTDTRSDTEVLSSIARIANRALKGESKSGEHDSRVARVVEAAREVPWHYVKPAFAFGAGEVRERLDAFRVALDAIDALDAPTGKVTHVCTKCGWTGNAETTPTGCNYSAFECKPAPTNTKEPQP